MDAQFLIDVTNSPAKFTCKPPFVALGLAFVFGLLLG